MKSANASHKNRSECVPCVMRVNELTRPETPRRSALGTEESVKAVHAVMMRGGADYRVVLPMLEGLCEDPMSAKRVHALTESLLLEATSSSNARLMSVLVLIRFRVFGGKRTTAGAEGAGGAGQEGGGEGYEVWLRRAVLEGGEGWLATKKTVKFVLDALQVEFQHTPAQERRTQRGNI